MQILVIGGTGFIGPQVISRLAAAGHDVAVIHRGHKAATLPAGVRVIRGDRQALQFMKHDLKRLAPEVVIDMICYNEAEAVGLVQAFSGLARRIVVASSQDVYRAYGCFIRLEEGEPASAPLAEDAPPRTVRYPYRQFAERLGQWVYDYDKILVEQVVTGDAQLPCTVLRLPCVYGPRDHQNRTFDYLKRMDDGREAILLGEPRAAWRWTRGYVENVAAALALAATDERAAGRTYNVGEPRAMSELEWAGSIAEAADWRGELITAPDDELPAHLRTPYDYAHHVESDTSRIRRELDYAEHIARPAAMQQTVAWQRNNPPAQINAAQFDYAAEEALLDRLRQRHA